MTIPMLGLLIAAVIMFVTVACGQQPCRFNQYMFGDGCYEVSLSQGDWSSAEQQCRQLGGHLTSVKIAFENTALRSYLMNAGVTSSMDIWMGGMFDGSMWTWADGSPFTYMNWQAGFPSNSNANRCLAMSSTGNNNWINADCSQSKRFMCKFPGDTTVTPQLLGTLIDVENMGVTGQVYRWNASTIKITGFTMPAMGPPAPVFWLDKNPTLSMAGLHLMSSKHGWNILGNYTNEDVYATIPIDIRTDFASYHSFGVWCAKFFVDFAHVSF